MSDTITNTERNARLYMVLGMTMQPANIKRGGLESPRSVLGEIEGLPNNKSVEFSRQLPIRVFKAASVKLIPWRAAFPHWDVQAMRSGS